MYCVYNVDYGNVVNEANGQINEFIYAEQLH